jgi:hypothetical protein
MDAKLTKPRAAMSTNTTSTKGQNKPNAGGKAGGGKARGQAPLKSASTGTIDTTQPGAMSLSAGQDRFASQQRTKKR